MALLYIQSDRLRRKGEKTRHTKNKKV